MRAMELVTPADVLACTFSLYHPAGQECHTSPSVMKPQQLMKRERALLPGRGLTLRDPPQGWRW